MGFAVAIVAASLSPNAALAVYYPFIDRNSYEGYFTGIDAGSGDWVFDDPPVFVGINDATTFINRVDGYLNAPVGSLRYLDNWGGAAYLVESMLGHKGTDFGGDWNAGVNAARADFAQWRNIVLSYAGNAPGDPDGWIIWNDVVTLCHPYVQANLNATTHDVFFFETVGVGCDTEDVITFTNGTDVYQIKDICGNPLGEQDPLTPPPPPPPPAATRPYTTFYNGDAQAGASFDCTVSSTANGNISAFGDTAAGTGSGSQIGAFAPGIIEGFSTAQRSGAPGSLTLDSLGSGFCMPDYAAIFDMPAVQPEIITGPHTVAATNWGAGARKDILVRGDVYISGNITFDTSVAWNYGTIPSFRLIVLGGNIYVDPSVTLLDGLYAAIPDGLGNGGYIFTCASSSGPLTNAQVAGQCGNRLTVTGAMAAKQVKLLRTYGDAATSTNAGDQDPYGAANRSSERFIFSPELWLPRQASVPPAGYQFDAISSLPPVL